MESKSAVQALPLLIINLGGEMLYIIEQRLNAQNIGIEKSSKVLNDLIKSILDDKLIDELFRPQELYSTISTRSLFEKIAHSSIMKLNSNSMSKLIDLMIMSVKYQFIATKYPEEMLQVTNKHLTCMQAMASDPAASKCVEYTSQKAFESKSRYEFTLVRKELLRFFQNKNIKVSLFLQKSLQNLQGKFQIPQMFSCPPLIKRPGLVTFIGENGTVTKTKTLKSYFNYTVNNLSKRINVETTDLGSNVFKSDKASNENAPTEAKEEHSQKKVLPPKKQVTTLDTEKAKKTSMEFNSFASSIIDMKTLESDGITLGFVMSNSQSEFSTSKGPITPSKGNPIMEHSSKKKAVNAQEIMKDLPSISTSNDKDIENVGDLLDNIL